MQQNAPVSNDFQSKTDATTISIPDAHILFGASSPQTADTGDYAHLPLLIWLLTIISPRVSIFINTHPGVINEAQRALDGIGPGHRLLESISIPTIPAELIHLDLALPGGRRLENCLNVLNSGSVLALHGTATPTGQTFLRNLLSDPNLPVRDYIQLDHGLGFSIVSGTPLPAPLKLLTDNSPIGRLTASSLALAGFYQNAGSKIRHLTLRQQTDRLELLETRRLTAESINHFNEERAQFKKQTEINDACQQALLENYQSLYRWAEAALRNSTGRNASLEDFFSELAHEQRGIVSRRALIGNLRLILRNTLRRFLRRPGPASLIQLPDQPRLLSTTEIISGSIPRPPEPTPQAVLPDAPRKKHILFVSGEPGTPGTIYRCDRNAEACRRAGHVVSQKNCADVVPDDLIQADIVILWRVEYSQHVHTLVEVARDHGARIVFDTDDLVFLPVLASVAIIDGIRTIGTTEASVHRTFSNMRQTMNRADACIATTETLATHMRRLRPLTWVLPNSFDDATLRLSRLSLRRRVFTGEDGLLRIGYTSGTRTHQRDFGMVVDVLARIMTQRSEVRLVLFREAGNQRPVLLMDEFPQLTPLAEQIEWRDMVPLERLPEEFARFDISIAPLETGNVFCEAKSEIKFLEAALAGVPSIVSPTEPFRKAIENGITGFLASTADEWESALTQLLDNPELRQSVAMNAYHNVLWKFGPQRQTRQAETIIAGLGFGAEATRASELQLLRNGDNGRGLPVIPAARTLFQRDMLDEAAVTVIITCYNYAHYIIDALESVHRQTVKVIDLIVVDDGSSDGSVTLIHNWADTHASRFNRIQILQSVQNEGLGGARNIGISASETPWFLVLDADNRLQPDACEALLAASGEMTAYVWPLIQQFGDEGHKEIMGDMPEQPLQLQNGNYIDAMALVARWAWAAAGGYYVARDAMGWEDYDLWATLTEMGLRGVHLPRPVAEYRVHNTSMTNSVTEKTLHKQRVIAHMMHRHPWLDTHHEAAART
ncbi:MAG: glycosyltransferase [Acetobacter sp.]|nr:glycosyltransferase [Acetobacter sp.]